MKRIIICALCFAFSLGLTNAQKLDFWLDAGIKVQYGFTALFNANATTANANGERWDNTLASGTKFGGKIGINFNYTGITLDVLSGRHSARFQSLGSNGATERTDQIDINVTDIYLLLRNAKYKGYFEIGPKISLVGDVRDNLNTRDLNDLYETNNLGAVLGFGTYILGPEDGRFSGILGFRFEYGFQDIVNETGRIEGGERLRVPVNYGGEAASTNPIFVGLVFEANWGIGGVGQARCGERSKFIWF